MGSLSFGLLFLWLHFSGDCLRLLLFIFLLWLLFTYSLLLKFSCDLAWLLCLWFKVRHRYLDLLHLLECLATRVCLIDFLYLRRLASRLRWFLSLVLFRLSFLIYRLIMLLYGLLYLLFFYCWWRGLLGLLCYLTRRILLILWYNFPWLFFFDRFQLTLVRLHVCESQAINQVTHTELFILRLQHYT